MKLFIKVDETNGGQCPRYAKDLDVGADVFAPSNLEILSGETKKICLFFSVEIPNGYVGFIMPRSGLSARGIMSAPVPIDPSYTGNVHAMLTNTSDQNCWFNKGDRIAQLVIVPCVRAEFSLEKLEQRGINAFASTGK